MGTIDKRTGPQGARYRVRIRQGGRAITTRTFRRLEDAKRWDREQETKLAVGEILDTTKARRRTLAEAIDRYCRTLDLKDAERRKKQLEWWKSCLGHFRITELSPDMIAKRREALLEGGLTGDCPVSKATANRYVAAIRRVLTIASKEWRWLKDNPAKISKLKEPRGRVRFLSDEERVRILDACLKSSSKRLYPLVLTAMMTGGRQGELMRLRWTDVDLEKGMAVLHETKNGERRTVPLVGPVLEVLRKIQPDVRTNTDWIFAAPGKIRAIYPRQAFEKAVRRAELQDFHFHDLRHTAASYLAMSGATLGEIAEILGHKTLQMVQRYAHLTEQHTRKVAERMSQQFFTSRPEIGPSTTG